MTREEEIIDLEVAFTDEWYKEHTGVPTYADAIEWEHKRMIAKAVEWLKEKLIDNRDNFGYAVVSTFDTITLDDLIEDFRKAMEE